MGRVRWRGRAIIILLRLTLIDAYRHRIRAPIKHTIFWPDHHLGVSWLAAPYYDLLTSFWRGSPSLAYRAYPTCRWGIVVAISIWASRSNCPDSVCGARLEVSARTEQCRNLQQILEYKLTRWQNGNTFWCPLMLISERYPDFNLRLITKGWHAWSFFEMLIWGR